MRLDKSAPSTALLLAWLIPASATFRVDAQSNVPANEKRPDAPLLQGLGTHTHPITTSSALAPKYFNQGLVLTWGFNDAEAICSFKAAWKSADVELDWSMY
jgi:hypothetical protein